jgi:cation:H+ antiporter
MALPASGWRSFLFCASEGGDTVDVLTLVLFIIGLVALLVGAEVLVRGAARLAVLFGISPLVIGLTVVAFGTSSPELAVSLFSSSAGQADIAVGNVVGSNICNILLILGISAAITPLAVCRQVIWKEAPVLIGVSFLFYLLALDGRIGRLDGILFFGGLIVYIAWALVSSRKEDACNDEETEIPAATGGPAKQIFLVIAGLAMLTVGSHWLVEGAVAMARAFGVSELIIGLTIVSLGTSLPEVATCIVGSLRGERDMVVGNVIGSNLFNILAVLGLTAIVVPAGIPVSPTALQFDIPVMLVATVACLPIFFTGHLIARWEGVLFLGYYVLYLLYIVLAALQHGALPTLSTAILWFALPLTALTIFIGVVRTARERWR